MNTFLLFLIKRHWKYFFIISIFGKHTSMCPYYLFHMVCINKPKKLGILRTLSENLRPLFFDNAGAVDSDELVCTVHYCRLSV